MSTRTTEAGEGQPAPPVSADEAAGPAPRPTPGSLALAVLQASRPKQWPKNLLVFAAPLAGATLGRAHGLTYALVAFVAFTAASASVYLLNDAMDAERDRLHPVKRLRPVASGRLPKAAALALAPAGLAVALALSGLIGEPWLAVVISAYVTMSVLYNLGLKHVPGAEVAIVALGFVLRALGGAVATHVPPSGWFLTVLCLGALMVAIGKRYTELAALGPQAAAHRPVMRWYRLGMLRVAQRLAAAVMLVAYLLWALAEQDAWMRGWHLASLIPLAAALIRFDHLSGKGEGKPVEDLIARDLPMICWELMWLTMFVVGL